MMTMTTKINLIIPTNSELILTNAKLILTNAKNIRNTSLVQVGLCIIFLLHLMGRI